MIDCCTINVIPGYVLGMRQPSLVTLLRFSDITDDILSIRRMVRLLAPYIPPEHRANTNKLASDDLSGLARIIGATIAGLQASAGIPVFGQAHCIDRSALENKKKRKADWLVEIALPSPEPRAAKLTLEWLLQALNEPERAKDALSTVQQKRLSHLLQYLRQTAPGGTNNIRFILAAHTLGIPVLPLPGGMFQYGWGARGRWFYSSITDETSAIGVKYAGNKLLANAVLKLGGIPVPEGRGVQNLSDALSLASHWGYPVVVKPADRDKGVGVFADLRNADEVRQAFEQARKVSTNIMLERHVVGTAFRVTLSRKECLSIVQRMPAGVTGDGISTVHDLVEQVNTDPRRSRSAFSIMKPIVLDSEALLMLRREELSIKSVPRTGQFVALRRAANISTGGDAIVLTIEDTDPSYLVIARRAISLLRLDIAAVDFITQDIKKLSHEAGTAIIEVNAQPQMGTILTHLHGQLLSSYVEEDGTIPSVLVLGRDKMDIIGQVRERFCGKQPGLGCVSDEGMFIGKKMIGKGSKTLLTDTRTLIVDPSVTALLLASEPELLQRQGLPLPFIDCLVFGDWTDASEETPSLLAMLRGNLRGEVWLVKRHPLQALAEEVFGQNIVRAFSSLDLMLTAIGRKLEGNIHELE